MTDKEKIRAYIEKLHKEHRGSEGDSIFRRALRTVLFYIDSMQEEPVNNDFEMALAEMIDKAQTSVVEPLVIAAQWKDELIKLAKSEEPVSEIDFEQELYKYFGQVKDFTLGMRIAKRFYEIGRNHQEPASEDLEKEVYEHLWKGRMGADVSKPIYFSYDELLEVARHFASWQKEQMMKDSVLCGVDGWFINNNRNCRKNGRFYKYYESTITHDKPLPMENGKDYRLITIKED